MKDFSLNSGERQTGVKLDQIRYDHRARYKKVIEFLKDKPVKFGLDCFCGNGYGTYYVNENLKNVCMLGIDGSSEAVVCAEKNYSTHRNFFSYKLFPFELPKNTFDFVICYESLEHVDDGNGMYRVLADSLKPGGYLFISVPNEEINNRLLNHHPFHKKHYTDVEIRNILHSDFTVLTSFGQNVYVFRDGIQCELLSEQDMELEENKTGQVLIYFCVKNGNSVQNKKKGILSFFK